ncbi:MAG: esterase/lipase family protein [Chloroflexota bacterium]
MDTRAATTSTPGSRWVDHVDALRPTVLVLGGFTTSPPVYRPFVRRLLARDAAAVVVANVWTPDWALAAWHGIGTILRRSGRGLLRASELSAATPASMGAPVLVVGHSAGGIMGRLLTSPRPFGSLRLNGSGRVGALVTLGTPHRIARTGAFRQHIAHDAATFATLAVPGTMFAPTTGYLAVASRAVVGSRDAGGALRTTWQLYRVIDSGPEEAVERPQTIAGDGLVPVGAAVPPGWPSIVLDTALHGPGARTPWYGAEPEIDRWWPAAVETWRAALWARVERAADARARDPDGLERRRFDAAWIRG